MTTASIAIGALLLLAVSAHAIKPNHGGGSPAHFILLVVLALVAALEFGAISLARSRTAARSE